MWSILEAVFGGAYLGGKLSSERKASKIAKQKQEKWEQTLITWQKRMTNEKLEAELELYIHKHPMDAAQMARAVCPCIPKDLENAETYLRILLAKRGKLRKIDAAFGIKTPDYAPPVLIAKQKYREFYDFAVWLKDYIAKKSGMDEGMYFVPSYPTDTSRKYYEISDISHVLQCGTYEWAPQNIVAYIENNEG